MYRSPFQFEHQLHQLPEFQLPELHKLALTLPAAQVLCFDGKRPQDSKFSKGRIQISLDEAFERLDHEGIRILLHRVESTPGMSQLSKSLLEELSNLYGQDIGSDASSSIRSSSSPRLAA